MSGIHGFPLHFEQESWFYRQTKLFGLNLFVRKTLARQLNQVGKIVPTNSRTICPVPKKSKFFQSPMDKSWLPVAPEHLLSTALFSSQSTPEVRHFLIISLQMNIQLHRGCHLLMTLSALKGSVSFLLMEVKLIQTTAQPAL